MTVAAPSIEACDEPPRDAALAVDEGLETHNQAAAPLRDVRPLAAISRLHDGTLVGGAVGRPWGSCCEI